MTGPPVAFVGDIHGEAYALRHVLRKFGGVRNLVFLGDYINRGTNSRKVLQVLIAAKRLWNEQITLLRGNHDQAFLDYLDGGDLTAFAKMGGISTIASYTAADGNDIRKALLSAVPESHITLLASLDDYFERDDVFASHCGPDPSRPPERARSVVATGSNPSLFNSEAREPFRKAIVCGHYVQRGGQPHHEGDFFAIDSGHGSSPGAPLTTLLWPERQLLSFGGRES